MLCSSLPDDAELAALGVAGLREDLLDQSLKMNIEYRYEGDLFNLLHKLPSRGQISILLQKNTLPPCNFVCLKWARYTYETLICFYWFYLLFLTPRVGSDSYVTFADENDEDIGKGLVGDGLLLVDRKGGRKLAKLLKEWRPMNLIWLGFLPVFVW